MASSMFETFTDYYPELLMVDEDRWNFLVTAAGLYMAARRLDEHGRRAGSAWLMGAIREEFSDHTIRAMSNCAHFAARAVGSSTDPRKLEWAVGHWILMGLFRSTPDANQVWLAAAIGEVLAKTFGNGGPAAASS